MAIKHLSGNRVTALSTDLVTETTTTAGSVDSHADVDYGTYKQITGLTSGDKITGVVLHIQNASTNIKVAVFTDSSNAPSTLLGGTTTKAVSISSTNTAEEFTLDTSVTVPSDGKVWVCMYPQAGINLQKTTSGSSVYTNSRYQGTSSSYSAAFPSTMWGSTGQGTYNVKFGVIISTPKLGTTDASVTMTDDYASGWTQQGTLVALSSGKVQCNNAGTNADHRLYKSIGTTLSDTKWVARFEFNMTSNTSSTYPFALTSGTTNLHASNQDVIGLFMDGENAHIYEKDGSGNIAHTSGTSISINCGSGNDAPSGNCYYYCELIRDGSTVTLKMRRLSHTNSTVLHTITKTLAGTISGLQYVQHGTHTSGGATSGQTWNVYQVTIYNGATAVITDNAVTVPNGSVAEETDTGKHKIWNSTTSAWVEVA